MSDGRAAARLKSVPDVFHAAVEREPTVTDTACQHAELFLKRVGMFEPSARRQLKVS